MSLFSSGVGSGSRSRKLNTGEALAAARKSAKGAMVFIFERSAVFALERLLKDCLADNNAIWGGACPFLYPQARVPSKEMVVLGK